MIVFRTPKGWTCPPEIDGKKCEDYWRAHQVPMGDMDKPEHIRILEAVDEELPAGGTVRRQRPAQARTGGTGPDGSSPHERQSARQWRTAVARPEDARLPRLCGDVPSPGATTAESARVMGKFLRDVMKLNLEARISACSAPMKTTPTAGRTCWRSPTAATWRRSTRRTTTSSPDGRVMEVLSEHQCQGWLEGYLLTGRHGFFSCYEAFIHIIDSMFNQHAKWLKVCNAHPVAAADRLAQLLPQLPRLAAGSQRFQPSGSRVSSTMSSTRRRTSSGSICRRMPIRFCRSPITACAAATTSTSSSPASSRRRNG